MKPAPTVILVGDSMFARMNKPLIGSLATAIGSGARVLNCAAGGSDSGDSRSAAQLLARVRPDVVLLSVGTNDCAPWKAVPENDFTDNLAAIIGAFRPAPVLALLSPAIIEIDRPGQGVRTNAAMSRYRDLVQAVIGAERSVPTNVILDGAPFPALEADGLHLTVDSYRALIPAMARLIRDRLSST